MMFLSLSFLEADYHPCIHAGADSKPQQHKQLLLLPSLLPHFWDFAEILKQNSEASRSDTDAQSLLPG